MGLSGGQGSGNRGFGARQCHADVGVVGFAVFGDDDLDRLSQCGRAGEQKQPYGDTEAFHLARPSAISRVTDRIALSRHPAQAGFAVLWSRVSSDALHMAHRVATLNSFLLSFIMLYSLPQRKRSVELTSWHG
jgi:hypothetical protein